MTRILECYYDNGKYLAGKSTTIVYNSKHLKCITAVLNSKLMTFYYQIHFNSMSLAGGYYRIGTPQVKVLPIAIPQSIETISEIEKMVDQMQVLMLNQDQNVDEIIKLFNKIDGAVYQAYGLTENEISIVEKHFMK